MTTPTQAFRQGIFDIVVERGSRLQRRCVDPKTGACSYRDDDGGACYVGLLLSDEEARPNGKLIRGGVSSLYVDRVLPERYKGHTDLLAALQRIHDNADNWEDFGTGAPRRNRIAAELCNVARDFGLRDELVNTVYRA